MYVVGDYIAFFQIFYPKNHFIITLPFYQNLKLGPTPTFYYQAFPGECAHPPFCWGGGLNLQPDFKKGRLDRTSTFRVELLGKRGLTFFRGGGVKIFI